MRRRTKRNLIIFLTAVLLIRALIFSWNTKNDNDDDNDEEEFKAASSLLGNTNRYVVISASLSLDKDNYMFYLPMTCSSWRRIGIEPVVVLVVAASDDDEIDLDASSSMSLESKLVGAAHEKKFNANLDVLQLKVLEYLKHLRVKIFFMRSFVGYEDHLAMMARMFVGFIGAAYVPNDQDLVYLSDADLFPIRLDYYKMNLTREDEEGRRKETNAIKVWNAFCCGNVWHRRRRYRHFPMAHVAMRKYQWRELIGSSSSFPGQYRIGLDRESIVGVLSRFFARTAIVKNSELGKLKKCIFKIEREKKS